MVKTIRGMTLEERRARDRVYTARKRRKLELAGKVFRPKRPKAASEGERKEREAWYYWKNRDVILAKNKVRRSRNKDKSKAYWKIWYAENKHRKHVTGCAYRKHRLKTNPDFKMKHALRHRVYKALKGYCKSASTVALLGCSIEDFWLYLESKFEPGMTRTNHGSVWHIDHIMPCSIFDLTKPEHQKRCFHFSNLQPLFARENQMKTSKIVTNQFNLL